MNCWKCLKWKYLHISINPLENSWRCDHLWCVLFKWTPPRFPCTLKRKSSPSLMILFVLSRNSVSFGDILWKTTFCMEDFPLLQLRENNSHELSETKAFSCVEYSSKVPPTFSCPWEESWVCYPPMRRLMLHRRFRQDHNRSPVETTQLSAPDLRCSRSPGHKTTTTNNGQQIEIFRCGTDSPFLLSRNMFLRVRLLRVLES